MNYRQSPFGPVAIIPATAIRNNRTLLRQLERSQSQSQSWKQVPTTGPVSDQVPINLAYYLSPPRRTTSTPPLPITSSNTTTLRRRDTAMYYPPSSYVASLPRVYRTRSYTTTSIFNEPNGRSATPTHIKAVSGPIKYPEPLYKKEALPVRGLPRRAYSRSRSADWMSSSGAPIGGWAPSTIHPAPVLDSPVRTLGRRSYHYPASYATYPPSTFYGAPEKESLADNVYLRLILKIAQLVVGAVVIGTVAGPAGGEPFGRFTGRTQTGGQIYVLVIACICLIITTALLSTIFFARRSRIWRNVDGIFNACAAFLYLVAGCVEAWYANCYPPFGNMHPETCRLVAWAICAIFAFVNLVLYTIDFVLAAQAGIDF